MLAVLSPWEVLIIVGLIVFLFGSRRISRAFRAFGSGGSELKRELRGSDELPPTGSRPPEDPEIEP